MQYILHKLCNFFIIATPAYLLFELMLFAVNILSVSFLMGFLLITAYASTDNKNDNFFV